MLMKGFILMISVLLIGCTPSPVFTLDDARNKFEKSSAVYRTCMNAIGGDHTCVSERLIMEADQKAYTDAMSIGLSNKSHAIAPPGL
jgi:hypothetical protein